MKSERATDEQKFPFWKKLLLALAGISVLVGLGLGFAANRGGSSGNLGAQSGGGGTLLTSEGDASAAEQDGLTALSPTFVKGGISFVVGFCLGCALRFFFKMSAIVLGIGLLAYFGLSYAGVIPPVDWSAIDGWFNDLVAKARSEAEGFRGFITANLPSAGAASLGLLAGFKR